MDKVTKTDVRKAFQAARELMRDIEKELDTDDFLESGDLGQDIIYLIAEVSTAEQYRCYKLQQNRVNHD
jgi:hypothetical protein